MLAVERLLGSAPWAGCTWRWAARTRARAACWPRDVDELGTGCGTGPPAARRVRGEARVGARADPRDRRAHAPRRARRRPRPCAWNGGCPTRRSAGASVSSHRGAARAVERRDGPLMVRAGAGTGKTTVLVERFVRAVVEDAVPVESCWPSLHRQGGRRDEDARAPALPRAGPPRGRAGRGGRLDLHHPRLLRAAAARPRAQRRHRPGLPRARRARGRADRRRRLRPRARGLPRAARTPDRLELVASYTPDASATWCAPPTRTCAAAASAAPASRRRPPAAGRRGRAAGGGRRAPPWPSWRPVGGARSAARALRRRARAAAPGGLAEPASSSCARQRQGALHGRLRRVRDALPPTPRSAWHDASTATTAMLRALLELYGERYEQGKRARSALDFEDLELLARDLLAGDEGLREQYAARFAHVLVDEFQDVNPLQNELLELLDAGQPVPRRRREPVDLRLPPRRREVFRSTGRRPRPTAAPRASP